MEDLPLAAEFRALNDAAADAVAGGIAVARIVDADVDAAWIRAEIGRLAAALPSADAAALVRQLAALGFSGARDYYLPRNSSLAYVLQQRRGIPISLALVVIGVADACATPAQGINFPGHFLVEVDKRLVDPFAMRIVDAAERADLVRRSGRRGADAFAAASVTDIVLRMLNNLRGLALRRGDHAGALDLTAYQLLLADDPLPLHVDRAELWLAAGVGSMARLELDQAIALAPDTATRDALAARLSRIDEGGGRVH